MLSLKKRKRHVSKKKIKKRRLWIEPIYGVLKTHGGEDSKFPWEPPYGDDTLTSHQKKIINTYLDVISLSVRGENTYASYLTSDTEDMIFKLIRDLYSKNYKQDILWKMTEEGNSLRQKLSIALEQEYFKKEPFLKTEHKWNNTINSYNRRTPWSINVHLLKPRHNWMFSNTVQNHHINNATGIKQQNNNLTFSILDNGKILKKSARDILGEKSSLLEIAKEMEKINIENNFPNIKKMKIVIIACRSVHGPGSNFNPDMFRFKKTSKSNKRKKRRGTKRK